MTNKPRTMAEKVWADHVVVEGAGEGAAREPDLIYIDLHLVHEVTSPQAFDGLRMAGRPVHRPDLTIATEDHNVPTIDIDKPIADPTSRAQVEALRRNCASMIFSHFFNFACGATVESWNTRVSSKGHGIPAVMNTSIRSVSSSSRSRKCHTRARWALPTAVSEKLPS